MLDAQNPIHAGDNINGLMQFTQPINRIKPPIHHTSHLLMIDKNL